MCALSSPDILQAAAVKGLSTVSTCIVFDRWALSAYFVFSSVQRTLFIPRGEIPLKTGSGIEETRIPDKIF